MEKEKEDKPEEKPEEEKPDIAQGIKEKVNDMELAAIEQKTKTLAELETRVDKKILQLKEIVADVAGEGAGFAGLAQKKRETPQEYAKRIMSGEVNG